uniref:Transmembrane protein 59 n=1 Tax=Strigamia maritima TaxID=126957 RepID=T1J5P0_STRMM
MSLTVLRATKSIAKASKMAVLWLHYLLIAALSHNIGSNNVFDRVLDDVHECKEECDKTYTQQTTPDQKHAVCCKRGCRFFSIVEFSNDHQNMNGTKDACMASCMEAYSQTGDRYACNIGCSNQLPFSVEKLKKMKDDPPKMHLLTPLMFVHNIYNNMLNHMSRMMSVSWSFYLQQDNGKVVVIQSEPEVITEYLDMDEVDYEKNQDESNTDETTNDVDGLRDELLQSPDITFQHMLPDTYHYNQIQFNDGFVSLTEDESSNNMDWLGCVARKSGLPRWLIGLTMLSSALAMVWLCFTTTATAPDHYIRAQKINLYRDLEYLNEVEPQEKMRIQPLREDEAAPLPLKIVLPNA